MELAGGAGTIHEAAVRCHMNSISIESSATLVCATTSRVQELQTRYNDKSGILKEKKKGQSNFWKYQLMEMILSN